MSKKIVKIYLIVSLCLFILGFIITKSVFYFKRKRFEEYYTSIEHHPQYYLYDFYGNKIRNTPIIEDLKYAKLFEKFFCGDTVDYNKPITFPSDQVASLSKVFFSKYPLGNDTLISEYIIVDTVSWEHWQYFTLTRDLHKGLPPDSLIQKYKSYLNSLSTR